ncbi:MAG TPA: type II toxin-antitoxin system death-on-curing family toxin [Prolixibacteraceae bacterium]|nr:type II toxin-antitoxin system death-on-curing family toxin [Prolixibacteraceae bacterium]
MKNYTFLDFDRIVQLNKLAIKTYGGSDGLRDRGLIESAIYQPQASFGGEYLHQNIFQMAAAYYYHISECQGFSDGNKRTGFLAMFSFLRLNGCAFIIPDGYLWPILIEVAEGQKDKNDLSDFLIENVKCKD